jgi:hypothetical protein
MHRVTPEEAVAGYLIRSGKLEEKMKEKWKKQEEEKRKSEKTKEKVETT